VRAFQAGAYSHTAVGLATAADRLASFVMVDQAVEMPRLIAGAPVDKLHRPYDSPSAQPRQSLEATLEVGVKRRRWNDPRHVDRIFDEFDAWVSEDLPADHDADLDSHFDRSSRVLTRGCPFS
jgi:hypothetical protein